MEVCRREAQSEAERWEGEREEEGEERRARDHETGRERESMT